MRAGRSGIARLEVGLGDTVSHGERIVTLRDTFGKRLGSVSSRVSGMVIGHTQRPLVNRGDAVVHVAEL
jgi:predicted deacylase